MPVTDRPLIRAAGIGVACSVAFAAGMAFDSHLLGEEHRIKSAVLQANDLQSLTDTLAIVASQVNQVDELSRVKSADDVAALREKIRRAALANLDRYERQLNELPDSRRKALLKLHSEASTEFRRRLGVSP